MHAVSRYMGIGLVAAVAGFGLRYAFEGSGRGEAKSDATWSPKDAEAVSAISQDEATAGFGGKSAPSGQPSRPQDGGTPSEIDLLRRRLFDAESERDALRREVAGLAATIAALRATASDATRKQPTVDTDNPGRRTRKKAVLARWQEIAKEPGERADAHLREMFSDFCSELDRERSIEELRALFRSYCEGYRPYRRALESFNERSQNIRDAVELRRAVEDLRVEERRILDFVVPHLTLEERRALELR